MKRKQIIRIISMALTICALLATAACNPKASEGSPSPGGSGTSASPGTSQTVPGGNSAGTTAMGNPIVTFPLAEEATFEFMIRDYGVDTAKMAENNKFWQDMYEKTNVKVTWTTLGADPTATLNAMFQSGRAGDCLPGSNILNDANIALFSASGMLMPIEKYVEDPEIMPIFHDRVLAYSPTTLGKMFAPDGHIYAMVQYNAYEPTYLESPLAINKVWLDNLGLAVPTTIDQLHEVLVAFKNNDCNGNGNPNDEIPLLFCNGDTGYTHMEALMYSWGIATKDSSLDSYVVIENGKAKLAPMLDAWKDAVGTLGQWYGEGLVWSEAFTWNEDTWWGIMTNDVPLVGVASGEIIDTPYASEYIYMTPPAAAGYTPVVYMNPGVNGAKNCFVLTKDCKNPEILMAWLDLFYELDTGLANYYNYPGEGRIELTADGKYNILSVPSDQSTALSESNPHMREISGFSNMAINPDDYANKMVLSSAQVAKGVVYDTYKSAGILNKNIWPRPYFDTDDATRIAELRTDIFNIVATNRAKWGSGQGDINAEWNGFIESLNKAGVEEFVGIMQKAYDVYVQGMS